MDGRGRGDLLMIEMNRELITLLQEFQKEFGDIVSLRELPASVTTEELVEVIKSSIENRDNIVVKKFGFKKMDDSPNIII